MSEPMTREEIEALAGYTPGPWEVEPTWPRPFIGPHEDGLCQLLKYEGAEKDADLIAAAPSLRETALSLCDQLAEKDRRIAELVEALGEYGSHQYPCPLSQFHAGRPTPEGGYEMQFGDRWYQTRPKDETPPCTCGYSDAIKGDSHDEPCA